MQPLTHILEQAAAGDPTAAEQLLPLVYDELRKLAAAKLAQEKPGQTLQATALVHEAYLRLVGSTASGGREPPDGPAPNVPFNQGADAPRSPAFHSRGHFFGAAAEAMRRILVEQPRRKGRLKRGGDWQRLDLDQVDPDRAVDADEILAIDEALAKLETEDPQAAQLVKLRFFAGLSLTQAAEAVGISRTSAYEQWSYARAWLRCAIEGDGPSGG